MSHSNDKFYRLPPIFWFHNSATPVPLWTLDLKVSVIGVPLWINSWQSYYQQFDQTIVGHSCHCCLLPKEISLRLRPALICAYKHKCFEHNLITYLVKKISGSGLYLQWLFSPNSLHSTCWCSEGQSAERGSRLGTVWHFCALYAKSHNLVLVGNNEQEISCTFLKFSLKIINFQITCGIKNNSKNNELEF